MDILDLFRKKTEPPKEYMFLSKGRVAREPNPLPEMLPNCFQTPPSDDYAQLDAILADSEALTKDFFYACRLPVEKLTKVTQTNMKRLLETPPVYELFAYLRQHKMTQLYENNIVLIALTQACAFYAKSEIGDRILQRLMPTLLGVSMRYYGVMFLKREEREMLANPRKFDTSVQRQRDLREQYLKRHARVMLRMAELSQERFQHVVGDTLNMPRPRFGEMMQVVRHSTLLVGQCAALLSDTEKNRVSAMSRYIGVLYNFASAWAGKRKRAAVILAEEWACCKLSAGTLGIEGHVFQNFQALEDLFRVCRCRVVTDFQASGLDAIFWVPERIVVRTEMAPEAETGAGEADHPVKYQWRCYKVRVPVDYPERGLVDALERETRIKPDPTDAELDLID